jgi:hypothetical protein
MTGVPKDAREVYCNDKGEPIAFWSDLYAKQKTEWEARKATP